MDALTPRYLFAQGDGVFAAGVGFGSDISLCSTDLSSVVYIVIVILELGAEEGFVEAQFDRKFSM